ncbi:MAG: VanZ family protein [Flavobacteriales bacterium]|nr:VanZ family protein [Flavobacteriales bacterium]
MLIPLIIPTFIPRVRKVKDIRKGEVFLKSDTHFQEVLKKGSRAFVARVVSIYRFHLRLILMIVITKEGSFEVTCKPTIDNSLISNLDKIIRFCIFGNIACLPAGVLDEKLWFKHSSYTVAAFSLMTVALLGMTDEYLQSFTATQHTYFKDVLADIAVVFIGWIFYKKYQAILSGNKGGAIS